MPADFSALVKNARAQIPVPPLDIEAVYTRSKASDLQERLRRLVAGVVITLGALGAAAALARGVPGWHLWMFGNTVAVTVHSLAMVREPMSADVRAIVEHAAFPVTLPDGLPKGLRVFGIAYSPVDHPTLITIQYGSANDPWATSISLIDTAAIDADAKLLPPDAAHALRTKGYHFEIGGETVLLQGRVAPRVQATMQRESAAQSFTSLEKLLPRIVILQKVPPQVAQAAERLAPPGKNIVLGEWDLATLPHLIASGKALHDSRTVYLTNIPQVHGIPDYRNATLSWPKTVALPAAGVRAVGAALRRSRTVSRCKCAILVHDSNGIYTIWEIDQRSLKATRI